MIDSQAADAAGTIPILEPAMPTFPLAKTRSDIGVAVKTKGEGSPEATEARRNHAAKRIELFVREVISSSPPLADHQKRQLVALLDTSTEVVTPQERTLR